MMNWTDDQIEELLNGYVDEELSPRQHTELQRLITHDQQIAKRLQELKKCKALVSSLPFVEAPAGMTDDIKAALERTAPIGYQPQPLDQRIGARHLLVRRLTAVAAMVGLVAVLATLVYTIVAPEDVADRSVAIEAWEQPVAPVAAEGLTAGQDSQIGLAMAQFNGRLEFKTATLIAVSASINRAIEQNALLEKVSVEAEADKSVYALSCSRQALNLLLTDLQNMWERFDSATLFVQTGDFGAQVIVETVTAEQIADIANQDTFDDRIDVAKDFAVLNRTADLLPGREILAAIDDTGPDLITIPKPVLTSSERTIKKPPLQAMDEQEIHLTIVVTQR
ncbi:MAG: hypothetical protein JSV82_09340 [Planctomycetota bacterium]|nr:MAG: hypothetical protein JSV82_09340 [Planctomycetota bacterium]